MRRWGVLVRPGRVGAARLAGEPGGCSLTGPLLTLSGQGGGQPAGGAQTAEQLAEVVTAGE